MDTIIHDVATYGLGIDFGDFDNELFAHIMLAIGDLKAVGVVTNSEFKYDSTWDIFPTEGNLSVSLMEHIKSYLYISVKLTFDPGLPSIVNMMEKRREQILFYVKQFYDISEGGNIV